MLLSEILKIRNINDKKIKIIRNTINRSYIKELFNKGLFEEYQSFQKSDIFKNFDYILSFTEYKGSQSLLYGFYKITNMKILNDFPENIKIIKENENWNEGPYYKYEFEKVDSLYDLEGRLIIDWGKSTLSWHQKLLNKEVVQIFPKGYLKEFPGYQNVILSFDELKKITNNPDANKQWKNMLSKIFGVYLILDKTDGKQYIGSAYGKNGIWERWSQYAKTKHGNNKLLIELLNNYPERYRNFQYSILNVLPNSLMKEEVIEKENIAKDKLGSKVFGFNGN
ncbi:MAG: GIY-YIG nuclease family protein [Thermotogota bacterium]